MGKIFNKILIQPKIALLIFLINGIIVISSALLDYTQNKKEIYKLLENQSHILLDAILTSSNNAILSYEQIKNELNDRLLNNALLIKELLENNLLSNTKLQEIANKNNLFRINIFSKNGNRIFSSHPLNQFEYNFQKRSKEILKEIFNGQEDTLQIGIRESKSNNSYRYVVALASNKRDAIVINIDAEKLMKLKNEIGFGSLLKNFTLNNNISYVAFQNENGIIAAAGSFNYLDDLSSSNFLKKSFDEEKFLTRFYKDNNDTFFESVHPIIINSQKLGIIRLGLSTEPFNQLNKKLFDRILIQSIVLILFGFLTFSFIFSRQNYDSLVKKLKIVETNFKNIFDRISDAVILLNDNISIETVNNSSFSLFNCNDKNILEKKFYSFFQEIIEHNSTFIEKEISLETGTKHLLISKTKFKDEKNQNKFILIISDITTQKFIEKQMLKNEQLTALSDLSSSVAHEIRNPLNAIATLSQQLSKDFEVKENKEEFRELTNLIYKEIKRINSIIENFLKFAKPIPLNTENFNLQSFFLQIKKLYKNILDNKNIDLILSIDETINVKWDKIQMQQVFINLIENSVDSIMHDGRIEVLVKSKPDLIEISFSDTGKGIPTEFLNKIFNLYFTTKQNGSGIGLSIVQKIILEHKGIISVNSIVNQGTKFIITIPKNVEV